MSDWKKITWGDITTMPEDGVRVECHRKFAGRYGGGSKSVVCWRMIGEARWHLPLMVPGHGLSEADHAVGIQVSIVHAEYTGQCSDPLCGESLPHDQMMGLILDTLWWRPL